MEEGHTSGLGRLMATSLSRRPMRRRAGSTALGRLVAATTRRCTPGSAEQLCQPACLSQEEAWMLDMRGHSPHSVGWLCKHGHEDQSNTLMMPQLCKGISLMLWRDHICEPGHAQQSMTKIM